MSLSKAGKLISAFSLAIMVTACDKTGQQNANETEPSGSARNYLYEWLAERDEYLSTTAKHGNATGWKTENFTTARGVRFKPLMRKKIYCRVLLKEISHLAI